MFQATRRRLALWYTAITAVLLFLVAGGFYWYVHDTLVDRVDDTLQHVVEVVQRSLVLEPAMTPSQYQVNLEASFRTPAAAVEDDRIDLEWYSPTGELLWSTFSEPLELPIRLGEGGETVQLASDHWLRQLTERLELNDQVLGYLRVSHPWFEVTKPIRQLLIDLTLGISLILGLVAASGWFLSRLAMEPIQASYQYLRQFTADASHELRNPIALIQTNVQVALADAEPDPGEQRQQLEVIERLTRRLGRLVDDLLFLTRQDSGMIQLQFRPCPLDALLMQVVEEQSAIAADKGITLTFDLQDPPEQSLAAGVDPFTLQGDDDQLVRLFTNLVSNAIQYTPPGGEVRVHLHQLAPSEGSQLQVEIADTGRGMPAEALPRLFERFYRVEPTRSQGQTGAVSCVLPMGSPGQPSSPAVSRDSSGSGLGLAIVRAIVDNHHGQIQVKSQLGQGTIFTVRLPQSPQETVTLKSGSPSI